MGKVIANAYYEVDIYFASSEERKFSVEIILESIAFIAICAAAITAEWSL